jgi:hypothetical protein
LLHLEIAMPDAIPAATPVAVPLSKRFLACMPFILKEEGG